MKRSQLIDIIYHLEKEMAEQKQTIEDLQKKLEDRTIRIQNVGSIASAALELNQLLETAQATADQYTGSVEAEVERIKTEAKTQAEKEAEQIRKDAEEEAERIRKTAGEEAEQIRKAAGEENNAENTPESVEDTQEGE